MTAAKLSNQHPVTDAFGHTPPPPPPHAAAAAVEWPETRSTSGGDNPAAISTRSAIDTDNPRRARYTRPFRRLKRLGDFRLIFSIESYYTIVVIISTVLYIPL